MKLPVLYSLDSRGKVRVFECKVDSKAYDNRESDNILIYTRTGLLNGKLIQKVELVRSGKQNRSPLEQAEFQVDSLWQSKLDEGYKSLEILLLKINTTIPNVTKEYEERTIVNLLRQFPEASYTNYQWDELPMLAFKFKDIKNPEFPYYAQPKLNGVRCLVKIDQSIKTELNVKLCSRGGQYYKILHLDHELCTLFMKLQQEADSFNFILDGEIYKHGIPLQDISGAARSEDSSMFASNNWLEYWIYDIIRIDKQETQDERLENLTILSKYVENNPHIKVINTYIVDNKDEVKHQHDIAIQQGYEGLILRNPKGEYEFNQRSRNLLKVKQYEDAEFVIIGCKVDENKSIGESFCFILKNDINDLTFSARPTGDIKLKEYWYNNINKYINKSATIRYFERSNDGIPLQGSVQAKLSCLLIEHIRPTDE